MFCHTLRTFGEQEKFHIRTSPHDFPSLRTPGISLFQKEIRSHAYDGDKVFTNKVAVSADTDVYPSYDQNVFTVTYLVNGATYNTDTYYEGDTLTLPANNPAVDGNEFLGWFDGEGEDATKYNGGESVNSDLTIYAQFDGMYTVKFLNREDGESLVQYFTRTGGQPIGTIPQAPFAEGKVFDKWVLEDDETTEVTAETVVNGDITAVAKFTEMAVETITAKFWYEQGGQEEVFETQIFDIDAQKDLPYTIEAPASTKTSGGQIYYPETPTVKVTADMFEDGKCTVEIKYVPFTAKYDFVYMLKDLEGDGYTEIDRTENVEGVLGSTVTPTVKDFVYARFDHTKAEEITQAVGQELKVYYIRKNFNLSYQSNGGTYVTGTTVPYGSMVQLSSTTPTRTGYDFAGWYSDEALTQRVTGSVTVEADTTLYAKWEAKNINYTIVYMLEKYDNTINTTSFVYDSSLTRSGKVGDTVAATSAPALSGTKYNGYENDTAFNATSSVTIAADGSSVLVVHYKLIRYTLVFDINRNDGRITIGGHTYTGSNYRIENVVLGQDVSSMWPATQSEIYDRYNNRYFENWSGAANDYVTKRYELVWDNVSNADRNHVMTYTANWSRDTANRDAQYWLQQPNGTYKKADEYTQVGLNTTSLSAKNIDGYSKNGVDVRRPSNQYPESGRYDDDGNWLGYSGKYTYRFYYNRAQYSIEYFYGNTKLTTKSNIYFEANINTSEYNYTPSRPAGVDSDYTWGGWYADSALQNKYTFDKMPGNNLALYAKWVADRKSTRLNSSHSV